MKILVIISSSILTATHLEYCKCADCSKNNLIINVLLPITYVNKHQFLRTIHNSATGMCTHSSKYIPCYILPIPFMPIASHTQVLDIYS